MRTRLRVKEKRSQRNYNLGFKLAVIFQVKKRRDDL